MKNYYTIEEDRMGNIIISHPYEPKDMFLQSESDTDFIKSILTEDERSDLESGYDIQIKDDEPRASLIDELPWHEERL